ncbi:MAG: metallopeptidase family protein [Pseudomonadota bacterium]
MKNNDQEKALEEAWELFENAELKKALKLLEKIESTWPGLPDTAYQKALILERSPSQTKEAKHLFDFATKKDPENFPALLELSENTLRQWAQEAISILTPEVRNELGNLPIFVEELPPDEELEDPNDPLSPTTLGLFRGRILAEDENMSISADPMPPNIVLYRRNIARYCESKSELRHEVHCTVWHEIGHYFGLEEEDLAKMGLE